MNAIKKFLVEEDGVTAIEYGLIAALVAVALVAVLSTLGGEIKGAFQKVSDAVGGKAP
ncbi:Flp family type IVb pilin [Janthinobacterium aquaticum]|uniref:Flp family type IVb pilin n=1 Tax=Janthinobacterium sp. FT58W TaxID=2654254 RepID=UPI001264D754|nr:Flp family type IVb pilin [Janthinobacterium sp. FT58W]KAB8042818.1 Flp family type IVb pilin [Janthinobacterium sp. FT58W]